MSAAWKDLERWVCKMLGTRRRGQVERGGWATGSDDDGSCPWSLEVKYTTRAQLRASWLAQCRRQSQSDGRPWLLYIGEHGKPRLEAPVVLSFRHFLELAADAGWVVDDRPFDGSRGSMRPAGLAAPSTSTPTSRGSS